MLPTITKKKTFTCVLLTNLKPRHCYRLVNCIQCVLNLGTTLEEIQ